LAPGSQHRAWFPAHRRNVDELANGIWLYFSCGSLRRTWDDGSEYPFVHHLERIRRLRDNVGAEQICLGTDWPWLEHFFTYRQLIDCVRLHAPYLDARETALFLGGNADWFLGRSTLVARVD
jgi:hypothetical protein